MMKFERWMPWFTAILLFLFVVFAISMAMGWIEGQFPLVLFLATLIAFVYWLGERFYFFPKRQMASAHYLATLQERQAKLKAQGIEPSHHTDQHDTQQRLLAQPWWLDWTAGLFPVIVTVFLLRSFVVEPFKIPSGSMIPTLHVGDLILVNKFSYGLRLPVLNTKILSNNDPIRGDVLVFRFPPTPHLDYIKRVIGVPGDVIEYRNKALTINGKPITRQPDPQQYDSETGQYTESFKETIDNKTFGIQTFASQPSMVIGHGSFPHKDQCQYNEQGFVCTVPAGHYFVMGDNRDNSLDSRYWGFVPDANVVGKAFFIWMNFNNFKRIGSF